MREMFNTLYDTCFQGLRDAKAVLRIADNNKKKGNNLMTFKKSCTKHGFKKGERNGTVGRE